MNQPHCITCGTVHDGDFCPIPPRPMFLKADPMKKSKSPFMSFIDEDVLYVELKYSGMHPLIPMIDGIPLLLWTPKGRKSKTYMKVTDAINWHEKELRESNGQSGNKRVMEALQSALKRFEAELKSLTHS
jgi:hypothetical protein